MPPSRRGLPGIWLTRGGTEAVARWAARGVVPLHVIPLPGWTAVLPAGESRAAAPYDACLPILAARPMPHRMRPALGFFVMDGMGVVSVRHRGRSSARFVVWAPGSGLMRSPGLAVAAPADLVRVAGGRGRRGPDRDEAQAEVRALLRSPQGTPKELLHRVLAVLGLPGRRLLDGADPAESAPGAVTVEPDRRTVERLDRTAHEEISLRTELGSDR